MAAKHSINFLFDGEDVVYVIQFHPSGIDGSVDRNRLNAFVKSVIAEQRQSAGSFDRDEVDQLVLILFQADLQTLNSNLEVLRSASSPSDTVDRCKALATRGPRAVMDQVLPLYISQLDGNLKFRGAAMRIENNQASLYTGEPFVSHEMELIVSSLYPEHNRLPEKK